MHMTTYNCPRCGRPSTAAGCAACGRGPEPLLQRLGDLDAVLASMPTALTSRAAVEAERIEVLGGLRDVASRYLAEAERQAQAAPAPQVPQTPASGVPQTAPGAVGLAPGGPDAAGQPGAATSPVAPGAAAPMPGTPTAAGLPAPGTPPHGQLGVQPPQPHTPPGGSPVASYLPPPPRPREARSATRPSRPCS
nr:hypothetical protein GCM10025732_53190 [Glycomyces mayteni]